MKKMYVYGRVERCNPESDAWHPEGGLLVITAGYPKDAVAIGTGNEFLVNGQPHWGLPEPTVVIPVPDGTKDTVVIFPDAGCC
jgi:hypothetical protein